MCGGASSSENAIASQQQKFFGSLQQSYQTAFAGQQNILNSLNQAMSPILAAGIGQYGFTPQEDAALRTQASAGTATQYANAAKATGEQLASVGGGNTFLPSGVQSKLQSQTALQAAQQESAQQLGITQAGYEQGRQNFLSAAGAMQQDASMLNPQGYANSATGAGSAAFGSQAQIWQQNQESSPWNIVGGVLGGAMQAGLGAFTGGIGTGAANMLRGGGFQVNPA